MAWERIKAMFTKQTGVPTKRAPVAVVEAIPKRGGSDDTVPRFRVERVEGGVTYQAYAGDSGGEARRAWELYQQSDKAGVFTFMDGSDCRGEFTR